MIFCIIAVREGVYGFFLSFFSSCFSVVAVLHRRKKGWRPIHRFDNILFPLLAYEGGGVLTLLGLATWGRLGGISVVWGILHMTSTLLMVLMLVT